MINSNCKHLTIVAPAYNEQTVLPLFHERINQVMNKISGYTWDIIYVNDGSSDQTLNVLISFTADSSNVTVIDLSRNFGKEIAMSAGFDSAKGDAVVVIDTDLQDPPELIIDFLRYWEAGKDVVYAKRRKREGETWLKKVTASLFYRLMKKMTRIDIPRDTGDYRLISRKALDSLNSLREQHRFMKGLYSWIGYEQQPVLYDRDPRAAGDTKFNYWKLWNFALEGITSFSSFPLRLATYLGLMVSIIAFTYGAYIISKTIIWGDDVQGYPSLMAVVLFLGGVNLMFLGIIGEYLGRMFNETKNRPLYLVDNTYKSQK